MQWLAHRVSSTQPQFRFISKGLRYYKVKSIGLGMPLLDISYKINGIHPFAENIFIYKDIYVYFHI